MNTLNLETPELDAAVTAYLTMRGMRAANAPAGEGTEWARVWKAWAVALNEAGRAAGVRGRKMMVPSTGEAGMDYGSDRVCNEVLRRADERMTVTYRDTETGTVYTKEFVTELSAVRCIGAVELYANLELISYSEATIDRSKYRR